MLEGEDLRVETAGQWTRGACVVDRRGRPKENGVVAGDHGGWRSTGMGNRMRRAVGSPEGDEVEFARKMLERVFSV